MQATIDGAGRIVIPKRIRDRLGLSGGEELEIDEYNGRIEIRRIPRSGELVEAGGILTFRHGTGLTTPEQVRAVLEQTRDRTL